MSESGVLREKELSKKRLLRWKGAMKANLQLAPCKYCGKTPEIVRMREYRKRDRRGMVWRVKCGTKKCPGKIYRYYLTREAAAYAWNKAMREGE